MTHLTDLARARERLRELDHERADLLGAIATLERGSGGPDITTAAGRVAQWRPGVCAKPKVKCAECANRRLVALSPAEMRLHLEGRQTAGIYSLLADETRWLVAIDLDGASWRADVGALRDAADDLDVPVLMERSRSGDARTSGCCSRDRLLPVTPGPSPLCC